MMSNEIPLRPATEDEVTETLSFALRFDGKKRVTRGDEFMASHLARHLIRHLELSGFVIMKGPPAGPHNNPGHWWPEKLS